MQLTEATPRRQAEHVWDGAEALADDLTNVGLLLDGIVEHLRRRLSLVTGIILILITLLLVILDLSTLSLDLGLVPLLLHPPRRSGDVQAQLRDLVGEGA